MAFINFLKEIFDKQESIESLEVSKLIEILKNYNNIVQTSFNDESKKFYTYRVEKSIDEVNKIKNLKGISLLIKFIDILKKYEMFEDSVPILMLRKIYGRQVLDIYARHDPEAPPFIRKGIDL